MADETGLRCPKCGGSCIEVTATCLAYNYPLDGTLSGFTLPDKVDVEGLSSWCLNNDCRYRATVADFRPKSVRQMLLEFVEGAVDRYHFDFDAAKALLTAAKERGLDG